MQPKLGCSLVCLALYLISTHGRTTAGTLDVYNVKQASVACPVPAIGDGVANDAPEIQCFLDQAGQAPTGGIVFLPVGTYRIGAQLNIPSSIILRGAGPGSKILMSNNGQRLDFPLGAMLALESVSFVVIEDLLLDGNGEQQTRLINGISLFGTAHHNTVTRVTIQNTNAEGYLHNFSGTAIDYNILSHSTIRDGGIGTSCGQIIIGSGRHNQIIHNRIERRGEARTGTNWGILLACNSTEAATQHNLIQGNTIINTGWGIQIVPQGACFKECTTQLAFNIISNNIIRNCKQLGIETHYNTPFNRIVENSVSDNGLTGIRIKSKGNIISHNTLTDNNQANNTESYGIHITSPGATDNVVTGNFTQNVLTSGQIRGIVEDNSADYNLITGNNARNVLRTPGIMTTGRNTVEVNNIK